MRLQLGDRFQVWTTVLLVVILAIGRMVDSDDWPRLTRSLVCRCAWAEICVNLDSPAPRLSSFYASDCRLAGLAKRGDRQALGYLMRVTPKVANSWADLHSQNLFEVLTTVGDARFASQAEQQSAYCRFVMLVHLPDQASPGERPDSQPRLHRSVPSFQSRYPLTYQALEAARPRAQLASR